MKLPVNLIVERLRDKCTVVQDSVPDEHMLVQRPMPYIQELGDAPCALYVSENGDTLSRRADSLTVLTGGARCTAAVGGVIAVEQSTAEVMRMLLALWDETEAWYASLESVILNHGGLQQLLQAALTQIGNPIFVTGRDFVLKGQAGEKWMPQEMRFFDAENDNFELYVALRQDQLYRQLQETGRPFLLPAHILPLRSWNLNLGGGASSWNIIIMEFRRPLHGSDGWLLSCLAPFVGCLLEQEQQPSDSSSALHSAFKEVLDGSAPDYVEISRQLTRLGWRTEDSYMCAVFSLQLADSSSVSSIRICSHMEKKYPFSCSLSYGGSIVCFFDMTKANMNAETLTDGLKVFIRDSFLKTGYSRVTQGHANLRRLYIQACAALRIGSRVKPHFWIHYFDAIAFPFLLEQATALLPGNMICDSRLLELRRHDETQGTAYMETLRAFLDSSCNASETARELFIHRSTLLYRLENIKQLLDSALDEPDELLYLSLSFRLLELDEGSQGAG